MNQKDFQNQVLPLKNGMFRFAYRMLKNEEEARDIVQDVLLKLWEKRSSLDQVRNLEAWCITLTKNRARDWVKSKSYNVGSLSDEQTNKIRAFKGSSSIEEIELKEQLKKAMDELPPKQKQIIHLRDVEHKTYDEIAQMMQVDMNVVKVNIHRARKSIKENITSWYNYGMQQKKCI